MTNGAQHMSEVKVTTIKQGEARDRPELAILFKRAYTFHVLMENIRPDDFLAEIRIRTYTKEAEKIHAQIKKLLDE